MKEELIKLIYNIEWRNDSMRSTNPSEFYCGYSCANNIIIDELKKILEKHKGE